MRRSSRWWGSRLRPDEPLTPTTRLVPEERLVRAALEAAFAEARSGQEETPARPAPVALKPFLRFTRLPPRALAAARKALDADDAFRRAVADKASEEAVGRPSWLFLHRPEGWEAEMALLVDAALATESEHQGRRTESEALRDAYRRLAAAEDQARRAREVAAESQEAASRALAALAEERRNRREAALQAGRLAAELAEMAASREQAELAAGAARIAAADAMAAAAAATGEAEELRRRLVEGSGSAEPVAIAAVHSLRVASEQALALSDALASVADTLAETGISERRGQPAAGSEAGPGRRSRSAEARPRRRRPSPLPPGILEDSVAAAEHLVRLPSVILLVDGYNVSHALWSQLAIPEQRRRLVDALGELVARSGVDVHVVFDGSDEPSQQMVSPVGRTVRVGFSPPGVEADDVVIGEVSEVPLSRPVVVASSDRRVRKGAAAAGANTISASTLLGVLGRGRA